MVQMVERMDPSATFSMYEEPKRNNGLHGFHILHHIMFHCSICLDSYKIWVFKNMQNILLSILWPVHDMHVCHTFAWTVYDIHATIRQHI